MTFREPHSRGRGHGLARYAATAGGGGGFVTITDAFTAADGTLIAGRTTDTGGKTWVTAFGAAKILSNAVVGVAGGDAGGVVNSGVNDATVTLTAVTPASTTPGILLRWTDASNYILVFFSGTNFTLNVLVGGVKVVDASTAGTLAGGDTLTMTVSGSTVSYKKNGGATINSASTGALPASNFHGFYVSGASLPGIDTISITSP